MGQTTIKRPPRLFKDKKKRYIVIKKKKVYIKSKLSDRKLLSQLLKRFVLKKKRRTVTKANVSSSTPSSTKFIPDVEAINRANSEKSFIQGDINQLQQEYLKMKQTYEKDLELVELTKNNKDLHLRQLQNEIQVNENKIVAQLNEVGALTAQQNAVKTEIATLKGTALTADLNVTNYENQLAILKKQMDQLKQDKLDSKKTIKELVKAGKDLILDHHRALKEKNKINKYKIAKQSVDTNLKLQMLQDMAKKLGIAEDDPITGTTKTKDQLLNEITQRTNVKFAQDLATTTHSQTAYKQFVTDFTTKDKTFKSYTEKIDDIDPTDPDAIKLKDIELLSQQLEQMEQNANGKNENDKGLWNYEIDKIMKKFKKRGYRNCIAIDTLNIENLQPINKKISFIMNTKPQNDQQKNGHWVACYIDAKDDMCVEYYDSFGEDPSIEFLKRIKTIIEHIEPECYLKMKVNKVVDQKVTSSNCGWFCIKYLMNRFNGHSFCKCTGFTNVKKSENDIEKFKNKYLKFGYI